MTGSTHQRTCPVAHSLKRADLSASGIPTAPFACGVNVRRSTLSSKPAGDSNDAGEREPIRRLRRRDPHLLPRRGELESGADLPGDVAEGVDGADVARLEKWRCPEQRPAHRGAPDGGASRNADDPFGRRACRTVR